MFNPRKMNIKRFMGLQLQRTSFLFPNSFRFMQANWVRLVDFSIEVVGVNHLQFVS